MANFNGVHYTKYLANEGNFLDKGTIKDDIKVFSDYYEAAAIAVGSTVSLADLPAKARIKGIQFCSDALGAGVTVSVGDSNSATRYLGATVCTAAVSTSAILTDGLDYVIGTNTGDDVILLTTGVGAATGTVKLTVFYTN